MKRAQLLIALAWFLVCGLVAGASAADDLEIRDAWIAAPPPAAAGAAGFLTLENSGAVARKLVRASSPACQRIGLHRSSIENGIARMRPQSELEVPAHGRLLLEPGGYHLMLMHPQELRAGQRVRLELYFANGERRVVEALVRDLRRPNTAE